MDPDIPVQSVESVEQPVITRTNNFAAFRDRLDSPLTSSSPGKTPFKTPLSHPATPSTIRSPQSPSLVRNERKSSPNLQTKRSSSSLSVSRGSTPPSRAQIRRVPSNLSNSKLATDMKPQDSTATPKVNVTIPEAVAKEYFERELKAHAEWQSGTVVIVHDSCYGHRFSRPKTSRAALSTIVERPERIHAILLGASTAYVRLGGRHSDGMHGPHPDRDIKSVPSPPFLLKKTTRSVPLNDPAVTHIHGTKWMEELQIMCDSAESKLAMNGKELQRPIGYGKDENGHNLPKLHEGDLYLCSESLAALQGCLGGVCDAVDTVFSSTITKRAFVCIRPPGHHCSSNFPSGFCWLNNVHVGISYAAINHGLTHAAIIDFDLHHGDGSQTITWDHNNKAQSLPKNAPHHKKTPIGYYSLHDINSYPCEWGDEDKVRNASLCIANAHGQSIWNVHLEPWKSLEHFWQLYETKYKVLLDKTRDFLQHHSERFRTSGVKPKAAIFLSAGFDASQWEGQGMQRHNVNVPTEFYARLTSDVVELASQAELGVDGRIVSVLEGGYSDRALTSGVLSHLCGLSIPTGELKSNLAESQSISNGLGVQLPELNVTPSSSQPYDPDWWREASLEALENRTTHDTSPPLPKREKLPGNYSSPTQASTARMADVARERRSISAQLEATIPHVETPDIGPPQPVNWIVASHALSQILIPTDRQTLSCRHDELNAEATRARRERQSAIGVAIPTDQRMQLRTRGKQPGSEVETIRAASRTSNRRTTIAAVSELPDLSMPPQIPRRRSSAASSILSSFQDMKLDDRNGVDPNKSNTLPSRSAGPEPLKELATKKTRMAPATKKSAPRVSSPRKAKATTQPATKSTALREARSRSASRSRRNSNSASLGGDGMDNLANEMKKISIKLKMPTPEQHEANQKKADESKLKKPRAIKKQTSVKSPVSQTASNAAENSVKKPVTPVDHKPLDGNFASLQETHAAAAAVPQISKSTHSVYISPVRQTGHLENQQASGMSVPPHHISTSSMPQSDVIMGNNEERSSAEMVTHKPPVANASALHEVRDGNELPNKTRSDLPVFTSTSPIPFANTYNHATQQRLQNGHDSSIWEIPDTPKH